MTPRERQTLDDDSRPWIRRVFGVVLAAVPVVGVAILVHSAIQGAHTAKKSVPDVVQLRLVKPPPPPPPPPPPKTIEQPRQPQVQAFKSEPKPMPDDKPPPPGPPALEGPGQGPPDAFGLMGGGNGDWGTGGGGGTGSGLAGYEWYGGLSVARGEAALQKQRRLSGQHYQVVVQLWIAGDGGVDRVEIARSSGKPDVDQVVLETLGAMPKLPQPPPRDMPMPVVLRYAAS